MREKKKIPLGGAQDAFEASFFQFLFLDLVIVTLWALFFWFLDVLSDFSDCSDCPDEKKIYRSLEISTKTKRKFYDVQDHNETYDAHPL